MTDERPSWDPYFLSVARAVAARADCRRGRHGAVVVDDAHRVVATGYNGGPSGGPSCLAGQCFRGLLDYSVHPGQMAGNHDYTDCIAQHAETNAIADAGSRARGGTIYITGRSCDMCGKLVRAAGIVRAVWPDGEIRF